MDYFINLFNFINSLKENSLLIFILSIFSPIGFILAIIFYFKSKRKKSIKYCFTDYSLIEDFVGNIDGLDIQFSGTPIKTLTYTQFFFWNNGTETIHHSDFPNNNPFSIVIDNSCDILYISDVLSNNISNNAVAVLTEDKKRINIDFEYLDKKDGFYLKIFHTSNVYPRRRIILNGSIKGFGNLSNGEAYINSSFSSSIFNGIIVIIPTFIFLISTTSVSNKIFFSLFLAVILCILIFFICHSVVIIPKKFRNLYSSKMPPKMIYLTILDYFKNVYRSRKIKNGS